MPTKTEQPEQVQPTARDKFVKLAQTRTGAAIEKIEQLGHLTNTNIYEYTDDDWTKIRAGIDAALVKLDAAIEAKGKVTGGGFTL